MPYPTGENKCLEANIEVFHEAPDAIARPSTTLKVSQDTSTLTPEPTESLPFTSSTSLDLSPPSVDSESVASSHSISTLCSSESPTSCAVSLSLVPSASFVLNLGADCSNDFALALPFALLASLRSSLSIASSPSLISSPRIETVLPFASSSSLARLRGSLCLLSSCVLLLLHHIQFLSLFRLLS
jgi:hypothetical protein